MEKSKICFKCGQEKFLSAYYKHERMGDGHLNKCKDCTKKDVKERESDLLKIPEWHEKEKERQREKYHRLDYKEKHKQSTEYRKDVGDRYREKYPEKVRAKTKSCKMECPDGKEKHHWSYNEGFEKDVIFLSNKDHNIAHRFLSYNETLYIYETLDGELLDTKEKHLKYIVDKIGSDYQSRGITTYEGHLFQNLLT